MNRSLILPDWPSPNNVMAFSTTRRGGRSQSHWRSLNLGMNCGDDAEAVVQNRELLLERVPAKPLWLRQVHGTQVLRHSGRIVDEPEADAVVTSSPGAVCCVLTADCLPVLFCNVSGSRVAVAHAGWRGLANGVLAETVKSMEEKPDQIMAWLGPAIGPHAYEVGDDVRLAFGKQHAKCFTAKNGRWLFDLYLAARQKLQMLGVSRIYGGDFCTLTDAEQFFSYRRDGVTGRMASLIWLQS